MSDMTIFDYNETPIRTVQNDGEVWWVLADICKVLGLSNSRKAATQIDDDEKGVTFSDTVGGRQKVTIVNEPGLYSLILRSNKPEAKAFKRWVTHEVLPAIRRNGSYGQEYDKMEIARMITECKSAAGVKAIMSLFDVTPSASTPMHIPQNANNSVTKFLNDSSSSNITRDSQKEVYKDYKIFCIANNLVPSTLSNFSKELHKQTGLIVVRRRINGILTGFYAKG